MHVTQTNILLSLGMTEGKQRGRGFQQQIGYQLVVGEPCASPCLLAEGAPWVMVRGLLPHSSCHWVPVSQMGRGNAFTLVAHELSLMNCGEDLSLSGLLGQFGKLTSLVLVLVCHRKDCQWSLFGNPDFSLETQFIIFFFLQSLLLKYYLYYFLI